MSILPKLLLAPAGYVHDWRSQGGICTFFDGFSLCLRFHHLLQLGKRAELLVVMLLLKYYRVSIFVLVMSTVVEHAGLLRFELVC